MKNDRVVRRQTRRHGQQSAPQLGPNFRKSQLLPAGYKMMIKVVTLLSCIAYVLADECSYTNGGYSLSWQVKDDRIHFDLSHKPPTLRDNYWTGVIFGTWMSGADALIVKVENGAVSVADYHVTGYSSNSPRLDSSQDLSVVTDSLSIVDGGVTARFSRPLRTADSNDKPLDVAVDFRLPNGDNPLWGSKLGKHGTPPRRETQNDLAGDCGDTAVAPAAASGGNDCPSADIADCTTRIADIEAWVQSVYINPTAQTVCDQLQYYLSNSCCAALNARGCSD